MSQRADDTLGPGPAIVLLAGVVVAGAVAVRLAPGGGLVPTFWPAAGLGLILLGLARVRHWVVLLPLLGIAVAAGDVLGGRDLRLSLAHMVVETLGLMIAALLVTRRGRVRPRLNDHEDFIRLIAAAVASACLVVAGGAGTRLVTITPLEISLATVFAAHVAAIMLIFPLAIVTGNRWAGSRPEMHLQVVLLAAACVLMFVPSTRSTLTFVPVLFLAWAALRFDLRVACAESVLLGILVTAQTVAEIGPFAGSPDGDLASALGAGGLTQGYLTCATLLILPLGIAVQRNITLLDRITADGKRFRRNFTESLVGMAFLEPDESRRDLVIVDLNDTALSILGGNARTMIGRRLTEVMDVGPDYESALARMLSNRVDGWRTDGPITFSRGDVGAGAPHSPKGTGYVTLQLSVLSEPGDKPFFAAQLLDVTAEYEARRDREAAQTLTNATLDTTNCIIMVTDLAGTVVRVNQATSTITGYPERELLGRKVWETGITPLDADDIEALIMWPNRSGVPVVRESDAQTSAGRKLRIVWNTNIVRDEHDRPMYAVMTGIDVTAERTTAGLVNHLMEASLTTAIVGIDTSGRISVANSGIQHLLGYERGELVGEPFYRLLKGSELLERTGAHTPEEAFGILIRGLGPKGETRARDWTWLTKQGGERLVSMTLSVAQDAFAAQSGYLCVARDVTEQRHSQELLIAALDKERTAVERLRALDQAKNEFVSTVSHELRTPVTSIVGYAEMMADGSICDPLPEQVPLLETINRNGQRLISMINDLLMLSGLDSETVQWRHDPLDLATTVGPVEDAIRPLLRGRRLIFEVERPASPVPVLGDRAQLERVMMNLLSNAVKFTEDGGSIGFSVGIEQGQAMIRVRDNGIGIPTEEQADLFQRFFRSSTAQHRQIQGTGLGLSIVAAIVSGHGGTIEVDSGHLRGSTFTVRIPLAPTAEDLANDRVSPTERSDPAQTLPAQPDRAQTDRAQTDRARTDRARTDRARTHRAAIHPTPIGTAEAAGHAAPVDALG